MNNRIREEIIIQKEGKGEIYIMAFNEGLPIYLFSKEGKQGIRYGFWDEKQEKWRFFKRLRPAVRSGFKHILNRF